MIGSMLMCLSASLVGVVVFLRKTSLIGEALSHAAYPGVVAGVMLVGLVLGDVTGSDMAGFAMLAGAFFTALLGMGLIRWLEKSLNVSADGSLCFVLSFFFGVGILLASYIQFSFANLYRQVQIYFYGQAATMTDFHILLYGSLVVFVSLLLFLFRKELKAWLFDPQYAQILGINVQLLEVILLLMTTLSIVIGIRSVGVVLMSAMLIAPAAAARFCTHRMRPMFMLAALFGLISACVGTYSANEISWWLIDKYPGTKMSLPTGPMIVLTASLICLLALFFAPEKGVLMRLIRQTLFRSTCLKENLLKSLWRYGPSSLHNLQEHVFVGLWHLKFVLWRLKRQGFIEQLDGHYQLTKDGSLRAKHIVRLHRLWELYLADYVGVGTGRVHKSAEEMEHILTPELELELTQLLHNPTQDPHHQPIPPKGLER